MENQEMAPITLKHGVHGAQVDQDQLPYPALAPVVFRCLHQETKLRRWCLKVARSPWLNYVSALMVLLNCASLAMYEPGVEKSTRQEVADSVLLVFFILEMLVKMLALGVSGHNGSYLQSVWHKIDLFITCGEILDHVTEAFGVHLQLCQALGPLRLIGRVPSMRGVVTVLLDTVPMLVNVFILYVFVISVFGILGVQLWAGQMRNRCFLGEDVARKYNVSLSPFFVESQKDAERFPFICSLDGNGGTRRCHDVPPLREGGRSCSLAAPLQAPAGNACVNWNVFYNVCRTGEHNPRKGSINFDNIAFAWITIFQVVTLEGWSEIMFYVMDAHSFWSFLFFIFVTIMGAFIMMNVCAVVIATQFSENMVPRSGEPSAFAAAVARFVRWLQRRYRRYKRRRHRVHPGGSGRINTSLIWRPYLKKMVASKLFDQLIMLAVLLSILTMVIEHHKQPEKLTSMLRVSNIFFAVLFAVEMVLKLLALGWRYFKDRVNIIDFAIVIISLWEIIAKSDGRLSVLRAFRLLRFVRLLHFFPYLKRQLLVLKRAIEEATALCALLLLVIFIFSIMGMHLFGGHFSFKTPRGETTTDRKNFDTLLWSMVTVFQILTEEDWNLVLYNAMAATSTWAALYFVAIIVVGKQVLLNILVGIVVQSFQAQGPTCSDQDSSVYSSRTASSTAAGSTSEENPSQEHGSPCSAPEEDAAPPAASEDEKSLNWIQKVLRWCKKHEDWSLYILSPTNKFRVFCQRLVSHQMFDHMVLLFILLNCITIAMERPGIDPTSTERWFLYVSRFVFSAVFLVEMLFKVLALGLLLGKDSYCRSSWNVVDGLLVVLSLVHIFVSLSSENNMLGIIKVLRLLRTLRPLRVIKRAPMLKLAVEALIASVKPIGNIVVICCMFFIFYGTLGVQLFKGKFFHCVGADTSNITSRTECLSANYRWERKRYNFDSLPQALMALFVMYSKDGWVNLMYDGLDAVGVDKQPVRNHNEWMLVFFITFMIMSFFLLDMFIGVMVETFHQCQQEQKLENQEAACGDVCVPEQEEPYYTHYSPLRRSVHTLSTSRFLELFMAVVIFISVLMMAFEHYKEPPYIERLTEYSFYVFNVILIIELLLKLVAFGVRRFMQISLNVLDLAVVLISIVSIVFDKTRLAHSIPINPSILRVCRVLRLAQVLKAKKIRVLLKTIIKTLSQVGNICLLFGFFFFIYAALGVELFGKLECSEDYPCLGLHRHANFRHFGMALLTLYQVCTGDNWSAIMKDTLRECRPGDGGCVSHLSWVSPICFVSFVVMAQFVLVNLVVAAIMQALEDSSEEEDVLDAERTGDAASSVP